MNTVSLVTLSRSCLVRVSNNRRRGRHGRRSRRGRRLVLGAVAVVVAALLAEQSVGCYCYCYSYYWYYCY